MRALVVEHDALSRPERVGAYLEQRGFSLEPFVVVEDIRRPEVTAVFPDDGFDIVVLMGAPWSVYDRRLDGWLPAELELIREQTKRGTPILGICFGAQATTTAMGGRVTRTTRPEYGWGSIGSNSPALADGPWFQFHHDEFTLPDDAVGLAGNDSGLQAYRLGRNLCVQFHPEVTADLVAAWCVAGGSDELLESGHDPEAVIEATRLNAPRSQAALERMIDWWLEGMPEE